MAKESRYRLAGDVPEIDIRRWRRNGYLEPGHRFLSQWFAGDKRFAAMDVYIESDHRLWLSYRLDNGDRSEDIAYSVDLDWTPCHLGGARPWFRCPNMACDRRCAILYMGGIFLCRHCRELRYPSQREARYDRLARRGENIRERLGWPPGILAGPGAKPKHMHWATFWKLVDEHDRFADAAVATATPLIRASPYLDQ
jgi:hypothetical protein